ncbi:hypothetical protein [Pyruvatibacter sp.]|uniref:hypothetical protein n=1 Tax=Pyruvatibacter sp. TaxID=1981328 RepID=UPI0032EB8C9A
MPDQTVKRHPANRSDIASAMPDGTAGPAAAPDAERERDEDLFERPIVPAGQAGIPAGQAGEATARPRPAPRLRGPRRPTPTPLYIAAIASAFWTGIMFAYAIGYYGPAGLMTLPPLGFAALASALFAPLAIIWGFAFVMWWGTQMRASADHMAEATRMLLTPSDAAASATASVGRAVSQEMRRMDHALKQAEARAADLRKSLTGELNGLEAASARAEMRARTLRDLVGSERKALGDVGRALEQESAHIVEATRAQVELVSTVTGRAADQMGEAQAGIGRASDYLSKTLEAVARSAKAVRENVEAQADRLDATAETAIARAGELATRFADQGEALNRTTKTMADDNERAVRAFAEQRETLDALAADLRERATTIETAVAGHATVLNEALDAADAKAMGLGPRVTREAERLTQAAREAASQIEQTTGLMDTRTADMQARVADATGHLAQAIDFSTKNVDASGERLKALLSNIGAAAQSAAQDMKGATDELGARLERLPQDAGTQADRLRAVMTEQISAIAAIAESVADALDRMAPDPASGAWPPADAAGQPASPGPLQPGEPARADASPDGRQWRLGDVLSAARAREGRDINMPRAAHHIIETLQSLSIDIDRALEENPPVDLWKRYRAGERNVFSRRLAGLRGKQPHSLIADRYQNNAEFRADAERYMSQFENLLTEAATQNPDGLLAETYMSSDIGKVYALLAEATGRIA